ncbi:YceI family protein [Mucilaginibacter sp. SP1R1]|uniref:YceI family protein n=1 Tax=Mucilaginibacter sp. SP1R1 TaxID=2723091 RepID=UPI0016185C7F|nr:YceI family protein [Mucilaginibacter sp. SP1R1]MBB6149539.1 polyisoprenoid-binding protein YceI [Mucilaginibacter sp. SP1R1]
MKKIMYPLIMLFIISISAFALAITNWKIKADQYEVKFSGGRIHGVFEILKANIQFDKADPEQSKISANIDVNSIATGFFIKNDHAKDALDADKYPTISFVSTAVTKSGNAYQAAGKLTMKGVTKPINIHFTFDDKGNEGVFKGDFKVIPKDFNITRNGTPDELTIDLTVPVTKPDISFPLIIIPVKTGR